MHRPITHPGIDTSGHCAAGVYRIEPAVRRRVPREQRGRNSLDVILASVDSGVDRTLLAASFALTPTERIETMRQAALSLDAMQAR